MLAYICWIHVEFAFKVRQPSVDLSIALFGWLSSWIVEIACWPFWYSSTLVNIWIQKLVTAWPIAYNSWLLDPTIVQVKTGSKWQLSFWLPLIKHLYCLSFLLRFCHFFRSYSYLCAWRIREKVKEWWGKFEYIINVKSGELEV